MLQIQPAKISGSTLYGHQVKGERACYSKLPVFQLGKEVHIQKCSFTLHSLKQWETNAVNVFYFKPGSLKAS